ncbi:MAG: MFS transporter [Neisseria sp.]|nr:MFS transporter [Neisseria sp.]
MEKNRRTVDVQAFLNENRFSGLQGLVFALCFLAAFFDGMDTAAIAYVAPALSVAWGLPKDGLAPVLSAALLGLALGALIFGPVADRLGRKAVLVCSVLLFSAMCMASAAAENVEQLTVLRFITGLGLGAAMPNAVALLSEYCPDRLRPLVVNTMYCGFPLGAAAGGFAAARLIPEYGWRAVLTWCGLLPLLLGVAMVFLLPRSPAYLAARGGAQDQVRRLLGRINPAADLDGAVFSASSGRAGGHPVGTVLRAPWLAGSVLLWLCYFMGLVVFYAVINWMPLLLPERGGEIAALFALGGLGAVAGGYLMAHFDGDRLLALLSLLAAATLAAAGFAQDRWAAVMVAAVLFAGVMQNTVQVSLPVLAARLYPPECRTTGIAWMLGIGRFGAVAGTFLVEWLLHMRLGPQAVFWVLPLPMLVLAGCLLWKRRIYGRQAA